MESEVQDFKRPGHSCERTPKSAARCHEMAATATTEKRRSGDIYFSQSPHMCHWGTHGLVMQEGGGEVGKGGRGPRSGVARFRSRSTAATIDGSPHLPRHGHTRFKCRRRELNPHPLAWTWT